MPKEKDPKKRKVKNQILSLGKTERERIKALKVRTRIISKERTTATPASTFDINSVSIRCIGTGTAQT
jgi:hypothetical protein